MKYIKNYGLSIILALLFFLSWIAQGFFYWQEYTQQAIALHESIHIANFIPEFLSATLENWRSELLQLLLFVMLTSFLIHKGSNSKDSDEEIKKSITQIEQRLRTMR